MSRVLPERWLPDCMMQRVVIHWTAGTWHATNIDREHYHFLIEGDGTLLKGDCSVRDNLATGDGLYAAHTRGLNTGSIGISLCGMQGAIERPFSAGRFPLQKEQYAALILALADLSEHYHLEPVPHDMLNHGEVERVYGKPQRAKWDINVLPWQPNLQGVGDRMRLDVRGALIPQPIPKDYPYSPVTVEIDGREVTDDALLTDGVTMVPLRPIAEALGWVIETVENGLATVDLGKSALAAMPIELRSDRAYVPARFLAERAGIPAPTLTKDGTNRTLHYTTEKQ
jgi:hypothetical protein